MVSDDETHILAFAKHGSTDHHCWLTDQKVLRLLRTNNTRNLQGLDHEEGELIRVKWLSTQKDVDVCWTTVTLPVETDDESSEKGKPLNSRQKVRKLLNKQSPTNKRSKTIDDNATKMDVLAKAAKAVETKNSMGDDSDHDSFNTAKQSFASDDDENDMEKKKAGTQSKSSSATKISTTGMVVHEESNDMAEKTDVLEIPGSGVAARAPNIVDDNNKECEQLFSRSRVAKKSDGLFIFGTVIRCRWTIHKERYWYIAYDDDVADEEVLIVELEERQQLYLEHKGDDEVGNRKQPATTTAPSTHPICENSIHGNIPTIPQMGSTGWSKEWAEKFEVRNNVWCNSRTEHDRPGPTNQNYTERGMQYWHARSIPDSVIKCVASKVKYNKMKKRVINLKGFGKDWKLYPLFRPSKDIHLCRFRYVLNPDKCKVVTTEYNRERNKRVKTYSNNHLGYFECVAKVNDCNYVFTILKEDLLLVDGVEIKELETIHPNDFTDIRNGKRSEQSKDQVVMNNGTTIPNLFSHKDNNKSLCVLGSICGAISALGFPDEAMEMFNALKDTLHQDTTNLWNLVVKEYPNYIKTAELRLISTPGGINTSQLLNMSDGWPIIFSILAASGMRSHLICICNGLIYDTNSETVLPKNKENLDKCARLHKSGSVDTFYKSHRVYRLLAINLGVTGKPLWNMPLPERKGWDFLNRRLCYLCGIKKIKDDYSFSKWKKALRGKGTCKECNMN